MSVAKDRPAGGRGLRALGQVLLVVGVFAAAGAVAGVVWEWLWTPPSGVVLEGAWGLDARGITEDFSGTGWYVVVGVVTGLLVGLAVGWLIRSREVLTLGAVVVGAFLAGWVMFQVGHHLGPPDPRVLAAGRPDGTELPADLTLAEVGDDPGLFRIRTSASVALPLGALVGLLAMLLTTGRRGRADDPVAED